MTTQGKAKKQQEENQLDKPLPLADALWEHHSHVLSPLLEQWSQTGRIPSVMLLLGLEGIGKRQLAHFLAQAFLCENSAFASSQNESLGLEASAPSVFPCESCTNCQRALHQNWVDFEEIAPEQSTEGRQGHLKIEQFRELKARQGFRAYDGNYRIILIREAEKMTPQAANSLLKLLEEPPATWLFILTATDRSLLLPTLLSRCHHIQLQPLSAEVLKKLLQQERASENQASLAANLDGGSWKKAREFCSSENQKIRSTLLKFLYSPEQELNSLTDWASQTSERLQLILDQLEHLVLDLLLWSSYDEASRQTEPFPWRNEDAHEALKKHIQLHQKQGHSIEGMKQFWLRQALNIADMRAKFSIPLNKKLFTQNLLLPWLTH